jgi:tRNA C32,U32 (ribose-2'-O)-methylase TrmJ
MNKAKSEIGRALSMAGTDIAPGYGAKSVKRRMKKAKGKDLTPKEEAAIDKLTKQLEEANTELTELQEKQKNDTVQRFVRSAKRGTPRSVTQRTADVQTLGKIINQLLEQGCI